MGSTINLISRIRDVHGSGRIGFRLNTHPIRTDWVEPPSTHLWLRGWSDWAGWSYNKCWADQSRLKIWKTARIRLRKDEKQLKSSEISTIFGKISAKSSRKYLKVHWIYNISPKKQMSWLVRVSRIWEEEIQYPTHRSQFLEEEIRHRPPEQSVWFAAAGGSGPAIFGQLLVGFVVNVRRESTKSPYFKNTQ